MTWALPQLCCKYYFRQASLHCPASTLRSQRWIEATESGGEAAGRWLGIWGQRKAAWTEVLDPTRTPGRRQVRRAAVATAVRHDSFCSVLCPDYYPVECLLRNNRSTRGLSATRDMWRRRGCHADVLTTAGLLFDCSPAEPVRAVKC